MTNLAFLRVENNLTQMELAVKSEMSLGAIQRAERSYDQMALGRLKQIASALDIDLSTLLEEELK